jgi:hypothetical protein
MVWYTETLANGLSKIKVLLQDATTHGGNGVNRLWLMSQHKQNTMLLPNEPRVAQMYDVTILR